MSWRDFDGSELLDRWGCLRKEFYTTPQNTDLVGCTAHLGDIVASGVEPGAPVGRLVAFFARPPREGENGTRRVFGTAAVCGFDGVIRTGNLGISWVGYCRREDWDGPTPNGLIGLLWPKTRKDDHGEATD